MMEVLSQQVCTFIIDTSRACIVMCEPFSAAKACAVGGCLFVVLCRVVRILH